MRRVALVVLVLTATVLAGLPGETAVAATTDRSFVRLTDRTGEVRNPRGDLRWVSARFTERQLVFKAGLKKYQHWKSVNWRRGITTMLWELDLDGDNYTDYSAELANSGKNKWVARLIDVNARRIVCRGRSSQDRRTLTLRLPWPRCLRNVTSFRVGGTMLYDTKPYDRNNRLQVDLAPPRRFSRAVRRPRLSTWLRWNATDNRIRVPYGATSTSLHGALRSRLGLVEYQPVTLDSRLSANQAWSPRRTGTTSQYPGGNVSWFWGETATRSMQFRMRYGGTRTLHPSVSPVLHLDVTMLVTATTTTSGMALGQPFTVRGTVKPVEPGTAVQLQQRTATGWKTVSTGTVLLDGGYSLSTTPQTTGDLVYRVRHGGDSLRVAGYSAPVGVRVYTAAITHVEPSTPEQEISDLNTEYVIVKNTGRVAVSLAGWYVEANAVDWAQVRGAETQLAPGASVRIHTGAGTNRSGHVYLNRTVPLWPPGGIARLYDEHNDLVHEYQYGP